MEYLRHCNQLCIIFQFSKEQRDWKYRRWADTFLVGLEKAWSLETQPEGQHWTGEGVGATGQLPLGQELSGAWGRIWGRETERVSWRKLVAKPRGGDRELMSLQGLQCTGCCDKNLSSLSSHKLLKQDQFSHVKNEEIGLKVNNQRSHKPSRQRWIWIHAHSSGVSLVWHQGPYLPQISWNRILGPGMWVITSSEGESYAPKHFRPRILYTSSSQTLMSLSLLGLSDSHLGDLG